MISSIFLLLPILGNCIRISTKCACGERNNQHKIVGGVMTTENEFPWMALLASERNPRYRCGGSLLNDRYIATAAHCIGSKTFRKSLKVYLGIHNASEVAKTESLRIRRFYRHFRFNENTGENDIALIELKNPVSFNERVSPLCLKEEQQHEGDTALVLGWGNTDYQGNFSDVLQEAEVTVLSNHYCQHHTRFEADDITNNMLCAGEREGQDACMGDSGGPLMVKNRRGQYVQLGIVSWGMDCATPGYPGVYTKLRNYYDWITMRMHRQTVWCI